MKGALGLIQLALVAGALFVLATAAVCNTVYPWLRPHMAALHPTRRARLLRLWCAAPVLAAVLLTALCLLPSGVGRWAPAFDHCPHHDDGHAHLCLVHLPASAGDPAGWVAIGGVVILALATAGTRLRRLRHGWRMLAGLAATASYDSSLDVQVVESAAPLAVTTGLARRTIFLSAGLLRGLPGELLPPVIEHERAHARRRDPLWRLLTHLLATLHLPATRQRLLADHALACEQACDEAAAIQVGDRLWVAQAMFAVRRMEPRGAMDLGVTATSFGECGVVARVEALLDDALPVASSRWWPAVWVVVATAAIASAPALHHFTESVLAPLAR
ncbi:MAG TPA: M48 family metalloprotease [bacterium]